MSKFPLPQDQQRQKHHYYHGWVNLQLLKEHPHYKIIIFVMGIKVSQKNFYLNFAVWHHQQIKWRQQARKISEEEQSFLRPGEAHDGNNVICQHCCWGYSINYPLLKILLQRKQGTYVPAVETGLLGELHPVLLQTHQKAADVNYQRSPPASRLWSSL